MNLYTIATALAVVSPLAMCLNPFRDAYPHDFPAMKQNGVDPGKPLFLTPFLQKGEIQKAVQLSQVTSLPGWSGKSYSGFITVNSTYNSNMFFWFFPAQKGAANAPVLMWLQGGPGSSSLFGLFVEHGPFFVNKATKLVPRNFAWTEKYSMLYVDNPVGTGFSFTKSDAGYANNEVDVGRDLYSFLEQFFQIYSDYQHHDFYITGESYGGKYVPAIAYKIHVENKGNPKVKMNLKGMAIGDGFSDPVTMIPQYPEFMFNVGLVDELQRQSIQTFAHETVQKITQKKYLDAFNFFGLMFDEFMKKSGIQDYYNYLRTKGPVQFNYYGPYLAEPEVRRAIHVGNITYGGGNIVYEHLKKDFLASVKPWVAVLMDNYKVMMYSGQLDVIVAARLTEAFLQTVPWKGLDKYQQVDRAVWKINPNDTEVAGWVRQVDNFYQVIVRNAGHILPYDQPARAFDMIQRFVESKPFA